MQESSCKNCTVKDVCYLEKHRRMYKRKCYIDALAGKIGKSQSQIMGLMRAFIDETGFGMEDCIPWYQDTWDKLDESSKMAEIKDKISWMVSVKSSSI